MTSKAVGTKVSSTPKKMVTYKTVTNKTVTKKAATKRVLVGDAVSVQTLDSTVVKGFALVEYLADQGEPVGVSKIAQHFDWQKSNVHRLLSTLRVLGYVRQEPSTSRYEISLKAWELGMKVLGRNLIKRCAQPAMQALSREFSENVNLTILVGNDVLYLDSVLSPYPLRSTASPGSRVPAIFPASGKSMLAFRDDANAIAKEIIASHPQAREIKVSRFMQELIQIRQKGYAVSLSGWRLNVNSVAAPVLNKDGRAVAAIGISGPAERMTPEVIESMAPALLHAANQVSEIYSGPDPRCYMPD